ncbi:MAG: hypothetical protein LBH95_06605 [Oscillospiraceae bacterium]|jgi:alpha-tubulin suppressor-like RCC1 family protein|nr:hypothetical protein [Oscillospiraceae bacterium]
MKKIFCLVLALVVAAGLLPVVAPAATAADIPIDRVAVMVSAGGSHTVAIGADGGLWAWGENEYGQLGDGTWVDKSTPGKIKDGTAFASVSAGIMYTMAIDADGGLWAWGRNAEGQLGDGTTTSRTTPGKIKDGTAFISVSAGYMHTMAIDADGGLWAWGSGYLGDGTLGDYKPTPIKIMDGTAFASVSAGHNHTMAIDADGGLWAWGINDYRQLGDGTGGTWNDYKATPVKIMDGTSFASVSAGYMHTVAIDADGGLWAWGRNEYGQLGDGTTTNRNAPVKIKDGTAFASVSAGGSHTMAIDADGGLWAWGINDWGQLGDGTAVDKLTPVKIKDGTAFASVSAGSMYTMAIDADGGLWAWGYSYSGQLGDGTYGSYKPTPGKIKDGTAFASVSAGEYHTVAIDADGGLWAWGRNYSGQLGDGTTTNKSTPGKIKNGTAFASVSAGSNHTVAIDADGGLWAWGNNSSGELGDGTGGTYGDYKTTPVKIMDGTAFASVSAGSIYTMAIDADGGLWAWGSNVYGQLGDGTTMYKTTPIKIMDGTAFASVSAGWGHTVAIDADGGLWAWGRNLNGQLGDGTYGGGYKPTPGKIMDGTAFASVSAGIMYTMAIDADGGLWAWGYNGSGQLGDGTGGTYGDYKPTPGKIKDGTAFASVSAGDEHTMAIDADGGLWAWGRNNYGQLGDGTSGYYNYKTTPVKIKDGTAFASVSAGGFYTMAIDADGNLWAWGRNYYGQLGDGSAWRETPVLIWKGGGGTDPTDPGPGDHVLVPSDTPDNAVINLTAETIDLAGFFVEAYSVNGGAKWKKGALPEGAKFQKLLDKGMTLWLADKWNAKDVKDGKTVIDKKGVAKDAAVVKFPKINARPKANTEKLKPFYFSETWEPRKGGATAAATAYEWANTDNKKTPSGDWQSLPDNGFPVLSGKAKTTYLFRTPPKASGNTYTPASKPFKLSPANFGKAPNYAVKTDKTGKQSVKLKANDWVQLGSDAPVKVTSAKALDVTGRTGTLTVWKGETGKKPRSEKQEIVLG